MSLNKSATAVCPLSVPDPYPDWHQVYTLAKVNKFAQNESIIFFSSLFHTLVPFFPFTSFSTLQFLLPSQPKYHNTDTGEERSHFEGSGPEWYISTIWHAWDTPFWLETLDS